MPPPENAPLADDPAGDPTTRPDLRRILHLTAVRNQAVGTLMGESGISADAAWQRLHERARDAGVAVDMLAQQLVAPYAGSAAEAMDIGKLEHQGNG